MDRSRVNIRIFDKDINFLGEVDDFTSLFFIRKWDSYGEFEFHLRNFDKELIQKGNIIMVGNDGSKAGIIEYIEIDEENGQDIKVKGYSLLYMLTYRLVIPPDGEAEHVFHTFVDEIITVLVDTNATCQEDKVDVRDIPHLYVENIKCIGNVINYSAGYTNLYDEITKLCKLESLGLTIDLDYKNKKFIFKVLEGRDLSSTSTTNDPKLFSVEYDNVKKQNYISNTMQLKNYIYVLGKSDLSKCNSLDEKSGLDRRELLLDPGDKSKEDIDLLIKSEFEKNKEIESYECVVDASDYKLSWDLGDIVTTINKSYDLKMNSRVSEVKETYENNSVLIEPTFGDVMPTILDSIKGK